MKRAEELSKVWLSKLIGSQNREFLRLKDGGWLKANADDHCVVTGIIEQFAVRIGSIAAGFP